MFDLLSPFADYGFMRRALVAGLALALAGAPLGVFLSLRRMSLMGDALSHALLPGVAVAFLVAGASFWVMGVGGLLSALVVVLLTGLAARRGALKEDAALAGFTLMALALGVGLLSGRPGAPDLSHILFGHILAVDAEGLWLIVSAASVCLVALAALLRVLALEGVDPTLLRRAPGALPVQSVFLVLVALILVAGFSVLGTLMTVGLMMLPALAARLCTRRLLLALALAAGFALLAVPGGLLLSFHAGWPSGPAIILTAGVFYIAALLFAPHSPLRVWAGARRHHVVS